MQKERILINDFGGYPFPIGLSRYLANQGYTVMHCYLSNINTPHGNMIKRDSDPETLIIQPVMLEAEFSKYSFVGRLKGELEYASKVSKLIDTFKPDIFLSANTPLLAQGNLLGKCERSNVKFIYWCQDIHSIALKSFLRKKIPLLGGMAAKYFEYKEVRLLKRSEAIITISEDFNEIFAGWKIKLNNVYAIHNWAPIDELVSYSKQNDWSSKLGLDSKFVVTYSGTLGLKHNPSLIANAAKALKNNDKIQFLVVSEGLGADFLLEKKKEYQLDNLTLLPFQDYKDLPKILSSADVLLSILENDAALYSVPSKVLTYLCSRKPIILSVPLDNLAAKIVSKYNAGFCISPGNHVELVEKIVYLLNNPELKVSLGEHGRKYAEENFDLEIIGRKFINVFEAIKN
ncbi:glycosyltransferase family 4 protein [Pedobacter sp.]|uniref:glycosyltransferase family 4 protein n=1 Tax=Pedobacter sp. TaxID=1411316 RepID=UPI0031D75079